MGLKWDGIPRRLSSPSSKQALAMACNDGCDVVLVQPFNHLLGSRDSIPRKASHVEAAEELDLLTVFGIGLGLICWDG